MPSRWFTAASGVLASAAVAMVQPAFAEADLDGFRSKVEKWVETRQVISKENTDWEADRQSLRATRDLLQQEKKALGVEVAELSESSTAADDERRGLLEEREAYQQSSAALEAQIREMEEEVLALAPLLPEPLQKKLEVLLVQIPEEAPTGDSKLGQRLMSVLGVLAQAEKWNATATFVGETRAVDGDQQVAIRTLYWGLGHAIYVDAQGENAGVGLPSEQGWRFEAAPDLVDEADLLLDIYEGNVDDIEFVELPVTVR